MTIKRMLIALPLALSLSGCIIVSGEGDWDHNDSSSNWKAQQNKNRSNISKLTLGLTRTAVLVKMGEPTFSEAFKAENGAPYQVLYYRTQREHGDGDTTKDETTALVFENDLLVGWGNDALQRIR